MSQNPQPPTPPGDIDLLRRFAKGDANALASLAARYEKLLLGLANGILCNRAAAADAVQETWLRVIRHAAHFDGRSSFKTWVYRILVNRSLDMRARRARQSTSTLESGCEPAASASRGPLDDEQHEQLRAALNELPESSRMILLLCQHKGLTHEQAAEVLGIATGTLKSRQFAAMRQLRAALGVEEESVTPSGTKEVPT